MPQAGAYVVVFFIPCSASVGLFVYGVWCLYVVFFSLSRPVPSGITKFSRGVQIIVSFALRVQG